MLRYYPELALLPRISALVVLAILSAVRRSPASHHPTPRSAKTSSRKASRVISRRGTLAPAPYNHARNGSSCGARSAYSRPGGAEPLCYPKDVSDGMVETWKRAHP
jgi:hypothetical protein